MSSKMNKWPGRKWFDRRPASPITPTMPLEREYPLPPYISPEKGKMEARDEGKAAAKLAYLDIEGGDDFMERSESPTPRPRLRLDTSTCGRPSTARRDSATLVGDLGQTTFGDEETLVGSPEECMNPNPCPWTPTSPPSVGVQPPDRSRPSTPRRDSATLVGDLVQTTFGDDETLVGSSEDCTNPSPGGRSSPPPTHATTAPPSVVVQPPDRTWHSAVASWQAMMFAQQYSFDLVYAVHFYTTEFVLPLSKFQTRTDKRSKKARRLGGQLLAAHGLHNVDSPLQLPVHESLLQERQMEYRMDNADPNVLAFGQSFAFYRNLDGGGEHTHPDRRRVNRGIVLAVYRRESNGPGLCEYVAASFVNFLVDLYVWNGSCSLFLDPRSESAEQLRRTAPTVLAA